MEVDGAFSGQDVMGHSWNRADNKALVWRGVSSFSCLKCLLQQRALNDRGVGVCVHTLSAFCEKAHALICVALLRICFHGSTLPRGLPQTACCQNEAHADGEIILAYEDSDWLWMCN